MARANTTHQLQTKGNLILHPKPFISTLVPLWIAPIFFSEINFFIRHIFNELRAIYMKAHYFPLS